MDDICQEEDLYYSEDRDDRVKDTAEVFTPIELIELMLKELQIDWSNPPQDKKFIDPTCGSGNFLTILASRGIPIGNLYGVDLMGDNIDTTKKRLTAIYLSQGMNINDIKFHLERNIIQADAMTYHYKFWWYKDPAKIIDVLF